MELRSLWTALLQWVIGLPPLESTFFVAMLPVLELRGAVPLGMALGMDPLVTFAVAVLGNLVPVIPFYWLLRFLYWRGVSNRYLGPLFRFFDRRAKLNSPTVRKYGLVGLTLLVAVPLPGTGAWTGTVVAALLDIPFKQGFPAIVIGTFIAGVIVTVLSYMGFLTGLL